MSDPIQDDYAKVWRGKDTFLADVVRDPAMMPRVNLISPNPERSGVIASENAFQPMLRPTSADMSVASDGSGTNRAREALAGDKTVDGLLADIRAMGWSVGVHNDYRLAGRAYTFWLLTHPNGRWVKGEAHNDADALLVCLEAIAQVTLDADLLRQMDNICKWQVSPDVHPLTCGTDSNNPPLFPVIQDGKIVLRCPACDYRQDYVPAMCVKDQING